MSIAQDLFCFAVPLMMLFANLFSVHTGVGGCWWVISVLVVLMAVSFWLFSNNPPNSTPVPDAITFRIMLHYTCTGPFWGGIDFIGVLDFVHKKKYPPDLLRAPGSEM